MRGRVRRDRMDSRIRSVVFSLALRGFDSLMGILRLGRNRRYSGYGVGIRNCLVSLSNLGEQMVSSRGIILYQ